VFNGSSYAEQIAQNAANIHRANKSLARLERMTESMSRQIYKCDTYVEVTDRQFREMKRDIIAVGLSVKNLANEIKMIKEFLNVEERHIPKVPERTELVKIKKEKK
jgi:septal ring factor EnvC (AmiA/AmiB activator)